MQPRARLSFASNSTISRFRMWAWVWRARRARRGAARACSSLPPNRLPSAAAAAAASAPVPACAVGRSQLYWPAAPVHQRCAPAIRTAGSAAGHRPPAPKYLVVINKKNTELRESESFSLMFISRKIFPLVPHSAPRTSHPVPSVASCFMRQEMKLLRKHVQRPLEGLFLVLVFLVLFGGLNNFIFALWMDVYDEKNRIFTF